MGQAEQRADTAFTEGYVEADGFRIRYLEAGHGSLVVMLHGVGGLIRSKVHDELAKKSRVIAFEMPGLGQSPANVTRSPRRTSRRRWRGLRCRWGWRDTHSSGHRSGAGWHCGRRSRRRSRWTCSC